MRIQTITLAAVAALSLGAAGCNEAEQDKASADANEAAADTGQAAEEDRKSVV